MQFTRFLSWGILLLFLSTLVISASCSAKSDVVVSTAKDFDQIVRKSKVPVLVDFYAPWCGHCRSLEPIYEKVASNLKGIALVVKVDATVETSLASQFGVRGYPTVKLFSPSSSSPIDYRGQRTAASMVNFVTNSIENYVRILTTANASKQLMALKVPEYTSAAVVLFRDRDSASVLYKSLAMRFRETADFYQTSCDGNLCDAYNVTSSPTLLVRPPGSNQKFVVYDGKFSTMPLIEFIGKTISTEHPQDDL